MPYYYHEPYPALLPLLLSCIKTLYGVTRVASKIARVVIVARRSSIRHMLPAKHETNNSRSSSGRVFSVATNNRSVLQTIIIADQPNSFLNWDPSTAFVKDEQMSGETKIVVNNHRQNDEYPMNRKRPRNTYSCIKLLANHIDFVSHLLRFWWSWCSNLVYNILFPCL